VSILPAERSPSFAASATSPAYAARRDRRVRTVYLGTSEFAVAVLELLARSVHRPELVVTRPDRPHGRGRKLTPPPVAEQARRLGIDSIQPESVNSDEARERIEAARPEVVCICAFGALIREPLLSSFEMLNVHPSLLPRWRGAAPIERAIEAGDEETGVTIMRPTAELDAGPMCVQRPEPIRPDDDYGTLGARLAARGGELLLEALDTRPPFRDQPEEGVTYAEKIKPDDRRLDPAASASELERRVRALHPHIGAWLQLPGGGRLGVRRARLALEDDEPGAGELAANDGRLVLRTSAGALELLEVQPAGGRAMDAAAWLRGHGGELARQNAGRG
jgi:methionyl-tRNA formyltransferase